MSELSSQLISGSSFLLLFVVVFFVSKFVNDFLVPYSIDEQLTTHDNPALAISLSGYLLATIIIYIGALLGPSEGLVKDLMNVAIYSGIGIVLLNVSRFINDKILLKRFSNTKEIVEDRNIGVGAVQFGSYVASGLIIAGSIYGEGGGIITSLVFFLLSQVVLLIFSKVYNLITPFDLYKELEEDNGAAGIAFGGTLVALGIILLASIAGAFVSWKDSLLSFGITATIGLIALPIFRIFFDKLILSKSDLNHEIANDRNIGAGLLEMTIAIGLSAILFFTF